MKRVLITSGGTEEPIDSVRSITNTSTGKLGSIIADTFYESGWDVTMICGKRAILPRAPITLRTVTSTQDVVDLLDDIQDSYDVVIHAMAISDYRVHSVNTPDQMPIDFENLGNHSITNKNIKISSDIDRILVTLVKTPKIIDTLSSKFPDSIIIGFKLLAGSNDNQLFDASYKQLKRAHTNYVVANHVEDVKLESHKAYLLDASGVLKTMYTKKEIAQSLVNLTCNLEVA